MSVVSAERPEHINAFRSGVTPIASINLAEDAKWLGHHGATNSRYSTLSARTLSRTTGSSRTGGKPFRLFLGQLNSLRARKNASSYNLFMCQFWCFSDQTPRIGHPWWTPPQHVRDASVLIVLWRRHTHSWTPSWRNWDVFHSFRARKTLCVTVNLQSRWQWGEMFWLLVHHWNGCMWSRPSWTTEDAATIRPNSLRHKPRWTRHPVLNWLWQVCNDCTHAGDRRARIMWESMSTPKNFVHWRGSRTLFCWFVRSPRICRWSSTKSRCVSAWSWDWANIGQSSK